MKQGITYQKLGDVCDVINGLWKGKKPPYVKVGVIRNANFTKSFTLRYDNIEYLDVEVRQYEKRKLQKGDLIVEKSGGSEKQPVGRAVLFEREDGEYSFSNFTSILRIKDKESFNSKFLFYFLLFIYKRGDTLGMQKATTGIHNIEFEKYLNISVPVISPAEQERIVDRLDAAFAQIDELKSNAEKQLAEARALFQSALKKMLEPKEGWENDTLINVFNFIDYRGATPKKIQSGVPLVTAKNVKFGYIDYSIKDYISKEEYETRKGRGISRKGDLLFTTEAPLGNVAIADLEEFSAGQRLITLQQYDNPKYEFINEFYYFYMLSSPFQNRIMELATGATAQGIKAKLLKTIIVPIPTLSEQQSIVATLDFLKTNVNCLQENFIKISQECDALKQALLRQIFE